MSHLMLSGIMGFVPQIRAKFAQERAENKIRLRLNRGYYPRPHP